MRKKVIISYSQYGSCQATSIKYGAARYQFSVSASRECGFWAKSRATSDDFTDPRRGEVPVSPGDSAVAGLSVPNAGNGSCWSSDNWRADESLDFLVRVLGILISLVK